MSILLEGFKSTLWLPIWNSLDLSRVYLWSLCLRAEGLTLLQQG